MFHQEIEHSINSSLSIPSHLESTMALALEGKLIMNALIQNEGWNECKEVYKMGSLLFARVILLRYLYQLILYDSVQFCWALKHILKKFLKNLKRKLYFTTFTIITSRLLYCSKQVSVKTTLNKQTNNSGPNGQIFLLKD